MKILTSASAILLAAAGSWSAAHAQVAYTNAALNGCYAHLGTSVYAGSTSVSRNVLGTLCFDGNGHILGAAGTPALSGHVGNTEGTVRKVYDQTGIYKVTNSPGDGMGYFEGQCTIQAFVLHNLDANGLAHGFSYIRTGHKQGCKDDGPVVDGGSGQYQGPLK